MRAGWKKNLKSASEQARLLEALEYLLTRLFGTTRLLDSEKISILHDYSAGQSTYIYSANWQTSKANPIVSVAAERLHAVHGPLHVFYLRVTI